MRWYIVAVVVGAVWAGWTSMSTVAWLREGPEAVQGQFDGSPCEVYWGQFAAASTEGIAGQVFARAWNEGRCEWAAGSSFDAGPFGSFCSVLWEQFTAARTNGIARNIMAAAAAAPTGRCGWLNSPGFRLPPS